MGVDKVNAKNIITTLKDFGYASLGLKEDDFLSPGYVVQLGQPPARIGLLTSATGLDFETCYESRVQIEIQGSKIDFIDLESFKKNKKLWVGIRISLILKIWNSYCQFTLNKVI